MFFGNFNGAKTPGLPYTNMIYLNIQSNTYMYH